ncbi:transcriptional regulator [Sulfurimonas hongkongensis]|uniref:Transcriptional regulator n=1 Tax=Sulfurimonas hongkongensis TaxID=1172190 RepID=T0KFH3_9BACT|nr:response regulator transcription factor [Sulfurimonas hongkongensis]EQB35509.1 transcriptional regulator [Sulfurimonas hongkongensis]
MLNSKEILKYTKNLSILFAEDHDDLRQSTTEILKSFFKRVDSVSDGKSALLKYKEYQEETSSYYDIVLSDIQMPNINGVELTSKLYEINPSQLLIILSAHDDTKYLLPLINLGIEQFVKKPIDYQELLRALLNSSKKANQTPTSSQAVSPNIQLSTDVVFDRVNSSLIENGKTIYLTKYEIIFMQLLSSKIGKIYSNEDIAKKYEELQESLDIQNIRKLVSKLRKKLPANSLESIYGVGYRIISLTQE